MEKKVTADVIVVGYGFAGAVSAITAHDVGVEVIILEKTPHFGGCSVLSGGGILCVRDPDGALRYFTKLCGGRTPVEVIKAQVHMMMTTEPHLRELCKVNGAQLVVRNRPGIYPFQGRDGINSLRVKSVPGFEGFPWLIGMEGGAPLMKVLVDNVEKRRIPVMTSTAAQELLTSSTGEIIGLQAERNGRKVIVKIRKAVILACGGFEHNEWLRLQFLEGKPYYPMAPLANTGDGVIISSKVGAALWHMWHVHGSYGFKYPEFPLAIRFNFEGARDPYQYRPHYMKMPWIVVDKKGQRFMNEYHPAPQDTGHRPLFFFDPDLPGYPRIPCFLIFDEAGRKERPIGHPIGLKEGFYQWSEDNSEEVNNGWIIQGKTLVELAKRINVNAKNLEITVKQWNKFVEKEEDLQYGRPPGTMFEPIENPPFFAMEAWPILTNTQGGPQHDAQQRVVDFLGKPIPRLYAAGQMGSMWGHLYELAGNIGECISSGQIAGKNAAEEKLLR